MDPIATHTEHWWIYYICLDYIYYTLSDAFDIFIRLYYICSDWIYLCFFMCLMITCHDILKLFIWQVLFTPNITFLICWVRQIDNYIEVESSNHSPESNLKNDIQQFLWQPKPITWLLGWWMLRNTVSLQPHQGDSLMGAQWSHMTSKFTVSTGSCNGIFGWWHHCWLCGISFYIDGLVQDCSNSIADTLELLQSCTKPSIYRGHKNMSYENMSAKCLTNWSMVSNPRPLNLRDTFHHSQWQPAR